MVIADTGAGDAPRWVIEGYSTMFRELGDRTFDAVFTPVGVGALGAAVVTAFRPGPTTLVALQASGAPCLPHSLAAGEVSTLPETPQTIMSGISCGTPSPTAWPLVSRGFDWTVTIEDDRARDAMRVLAREGIVSGETGAGAQTLAPRCQQHRGARPHRVANNADTVSINTGLLLQPVDRLSEVFSKARQGGETVAIATAMATCIEEKQGVSGGM